MQVTTCALSAVILWYNVQDVALAWHQSSLMMYVRKIISCNTVLKRSTCLDSPDWHHTVCTQLHILCGYTRPNSDDMWNSNSCNIIHALFFYMSQCIEWVCVGGGEDAFTSCQNQFDQDCRNTHRKSHREKFKVCISKLPRAHSVLQKGCYSPHLFDQVRSLAYCTQGYHCHIFSQSCCPQLHLLCRQHS